jgi:starch phosphorylase
MLDHAVRNKLQGIYANLNSSQSVRVELYADPIRDARAFRQDMRRLDSRVGAVGAKVHVASAPAGRPAGDYTVRKRPFSTVNVPLEAAYVLWQR